MPTAAHGLLGRLDALIDLVTRRRCLFLGSGAQLTRADAAAVAQATGLDPPARQVEAAGREDGGDQAVEVLRLLAQAVGLLRVRGSRLEPTALCAPWERLEEGLRGGLVYAAWCHRVPWTAVLGPGRAVERLERDRLWVLRLLFGLPAAVEVDVDGLAATVGERFGLGAGDHLTTALAAAFLDPLVALGVAELHPAPPRPPARLRLAAHAQTVIGSALVAAGEEVPLGATPN
ncbi:MAG TPA: hypothetical protein VGM21_02760 [Actinomycetota bacterium]|jgi:hypothetical protein